MYFLKQVQSSTYLFLFCSLLISFPDQPGFAFSAALLWSLWTAPVLLKTPLEGVETPERSRAASPRFQGTGGTIQDRVAAVQSVGEWVCAGQEESLLAEVREAC